MRRSAGINALAALALALAAVLATAAAASAADIQIRNARSGETTAVSFDSLKGSFDVDADYVVRGKSSATTRHVIGISLAHLMDVAHADPVYSAIEIARPGGGAVTVSKTQLIASGLRPVIYEQDGGLVFLRPSSGSADYNANDVIAFSGDARLEQTDLPGVKLRASASRNPARAGQLITFSVASTGGAAGARYEYTWVFRDGASAKGQSVRHRFKRGTYQVLVSAREAGSDVSSDPAWVTVRVGAKVKSDKQRSGGGTNDAAGAPTSGAADGSSGGGDVATGGTPDSARKTAKRTPEPSASRPLPVVRGEVLSAASTPLQVDSGLAARSGNEADVKVSGGSTLGTAEGIVLGTLLLLGLGLLSEFGVLAAIGRWRHGLHHPA